MKLSSVFSAPAALVILLCFFLPWVTVSCGGQNLVSMSGLDLAGGKEISTGFSVERTEGDPLLFVIPIVGLASLFLALRSSQTGANGGTAKGQLVAALLAIGILALKWLQMDDAAAEASGGMAIITISTEVGLWGTIAGLGALVLGAIVALNEKARPVTESDVTYSLPQPIPPPPALSCISCNESFARPMKFCPMCGAKQ